MKGAAGKLPPLGKVDAFPNMNFVHQTFFGTTQRQQIVEENSTREIVRPSSTHAVVRLCRSISDKLWFKPHYWIANEFSFSIFITQLFQRVSQLSSACSFLRTPSCTVIQSVVKKLIQLQEKFALVVVFSMIQTLRYSGAT